MDSIWLGWLGLPHGRKPANLVSNVEKSTPQTIFWSPLDPRDRQETRYGWWKKNWSPTPQLNPLKLVKLDPPFQNISVDQHCVYQWFWIRFSMVSYETWLPNSVVCFTTMVELSIVLRSRTHRIKLFQWKHGTRYWSSLSSSRWSNMAKEKQTPCISI